MRFKIGTFANRNRHFQTLKCPILQDAMILVKKPRDDFLKPSMPVIHIKSVTLQNVKDRLTDDHLNHKLQDERTFQAVETRVGGQKNISAGLAHAHCVLTGSFCL